MRIEVNLETGEITEHEDAPVTWEFPVEVAVEIAVTPTKEQLLMQLQQIQEQINNL